MNDIKNITINRYIESNLFSNSFHFIRHGETDWNRLHIGQGQSDIPLNERGLEQACKAAEQLKDVGIVSIATSPLKRAAKTAEVIGQVISCPVTVVEDLKECSWGIMEGKPKGDGEWIHEWRNGGQLEGVEAFSVFTNRVMKGLQQALILQGPVLVVAHGAVYWAIQEALGLPFMDLPNCMPVLHHKNSI